MFETNSSLCLYLEQDSWKPSQTRICDVSRRNKPVKAMGGFEESCGRYLSWRRRVTPALADLVGPRNTRACFPSQRTLTETKWELPLLWHRMTTRYLEIRWTTASPTLKTRERNLVRTSNCSRASCVHWRLRHVCSRKTRRNATRSKRDLRFSDPPVVPAAIWLKWRQPAKARC